VLVVPVRALLAPVVDGLGELEPVHLAKGLEVGLETTAERLAAAAYTRVDMVENRGEFAVRGGILDVFPPTLARPVRVDFFGDEIESVSTFAVADQRTIEEIDAVTATACREIVLTDAVRERARALVDVIPGAADMLGKIAEGINCEGMESLAPVLVERMVPLLDLVGDRLVVGLEPERLRKRAEDLVATTAEFLAAAWTSAASGGTAPIDLSAAAFAHLAEARALALSTNRGWWSLSSLASSPDTVELPLRDPKGYRGRLEEAVKDLGALAREDWSVVVATDGPGPGRRIARPCCRFGSRKPPIRWPNAHLRVHDPINQEKNDLVHVESSQSRPPTEPTGQRSASRWLRQRQALSRAVLVPRRRWSIHRIRRVQHSGDDLRT